MDKLHSWANTLGVLAVPILLGFYFGGQLNNKIEENTKFREAYVATAAYDDTALMNRVSQLEKTNIDKELAVINQKIDNLKPYDPTEIEKAVNDIKIELAKIQAKLEQKETVK